MRRWVIQGGVSWFFAGWEDGEALHASLPDQSWGKTRPVVFTDFDEVERTLGELRAVYESGDQRTWRTKFSPVPLASPAIIVDIDGDPVDRKTCWWLHENSAEEVHANARPDLPTPEVQVSWEAEEAVDGEEEPRHWGSFIKVNRPAVRVGDQWVRRCPSLKVVPITSGRVC